MKVSELAKQYNTTADTVRHYTRIGLLKPTINPFNGYKQYQDKEQSRLAFILAARQLGFTLNDIQLILKESDQGKSACPLVRKLIEQRMVEFNRQFEEILALKNRMEQAIQQWQSKPNVMPTGNGICHLIEQFNEP